MKRVLLALLATLLACFLLLWFGSLALDTIIRRGAYPTRANPDVLGLVASTSLQPVTLALETNRMSQPPRDNPATGRGQWLPPLAVDHRISFSIPAAYVNVMALREGGSGSQRLGFWLWSETLDPVMPDSVADKQKCRIGVPCYGEDSDRGAQRQRAGEVALRIEVTNSVRTEADRHRVLRGRSSMGEGTNAPRKPCKVTRDVELDMLVAETPEGLQPREACDFLGNPGIRTRDGKSFAPKRFLKLDAEGRPKFIVRCDAYNPDKQDPDRLGCELQGHLGIWPLFIWGVRSSEAERWDDTYNRVSDFIGRHVTTRTDRPSPE